jgi:hypothetical protein
VKRYIVTGSDVNVFGAPKRRRVEVLARNSDHARTEARRLFPTMVVDDDPFAVVLARHGGVTIWDES